MNLKAQLLERERRWALAAGILSMLGVVLIAFSYVYAGSNIPGGDGAAKYLMSVDDNRSALVIANVLQAIGLLLLTAPLVYLFKAASGRTDRMRTGLIGVIIVAPLFLAGASISNSISTLGAATTFKEKSAPRVEACINAKNADSGDAPIGATGPNSKNGTKTDADKPANSGAAGDDNVATDCADDTATEIRNESSTNGITVGLGLAGGVGFAISVVYVALWAMRLGLISRFWGSLGIALGAVSILFLQFTLLWFIYAGLLIAGWVPGGRPPAWAAGEAMPWLVPGRDDGEGGDDEGEGDVIEGSAEPVEPGEARDFPDSADTPQIERRKRKKRNP